MHCKRGFSTLLAVLAVEMLGTAFGYAQQPLLQITAPANNTLATEGQPITITVSADPSSRTPT